MSDEIRAEEEVEAHGGVLEGGVLEGGVLEGGVLEGGVLEAADDDVEAHGPVFSEGGVLEDAKGFLENAK
jgi:hypothetical protein